MPPSLPSSTAASAGSRLASTIGPLGSERRQVVLNSLWTSSAFLASAVVTFFLSPFILRTLGKSSYGVWEIVMSLTGYLGFADLGVRPAVVYFVARHDARGEREEVNRYVNAALVTFGVAGALVFACALVVAPQIPNWFDVAPSEAADATLAVLLTSGSLALTLPLNAFSAVVVGKQRYGLLCGTDVLVILAKAAAIVLVLRAGHGILGLAYVTVAADLVEMTAKATWAFRIQPGLRIAPTLASVARCRALLRYGGAALLVGLAELLIWRTDAVVIGATLGAEAVAVFAVGSRLPGYARALTMAASRVLTPAAARLDALGQRTDLVRMLARGSRSMLVVGGAILAYLLGVGEPFLVRWQSAEFRGDAVAVLAALTIGAVGPIAAYPFEAVLWGTGRVRLLGILALAEALTNLAASLLLARPLGIVGVALGTAVPSLIVRLVVVPWFAVRAFGGRLLPLALRAWATPLLAIAAVALLLKVLVDPAAPLGWPALLGLAAGTQLAFLGLSVLLARLAPPALRLATLPVPAMCRVTVTG